MKISDDNPNLFLRILPDDANEDLREENAIPSHEVSAAIQEGKDIVVRNCLIRGELALFSTSIEGNIEITDCYIEGALDCSYATFNHELRLSGTVFEEEVNFQCARVPAIILEDAELRGAAIFDGARIEGPAFFDRLIFERESSFIGIHIEDAFFCRKTMFKGKSSFSSGVFQGGALFNETTFDKAVNFVSALVEKSFEFIESKFKKQAAFTKIYVNGSAYFENANFNRNSIFNLAEISGIGQLNGATFGGRADFRGSSIRWLECILTDFKQSVDFSLSNLGVADLSEAKFHGESDFVLCSAKTARFTKVTFMKDVSFNQSCIDGSALFGNTRFDGEADFEQASVHGPADFKKTIFKRPAIFRGAKFAGSVIFSDAKFNSNTDFDEAHFQRDVKFLGTTFIEDASFQHVCIGELFFGDPELPSDPNLTQFQGNINFRGCRYEHLEPSSFWRELADRLEPFDRQPFTQLENLFRRAGKDEIATDVYYTRKRKESDRLTLRDKGWLIDRFLWLFTGYGVRLGRLLYAIIPLLIAGTFVFGMVEGALVHLVTPSKIPNLIDGFLVTLNWFLPVTIPVDVEWKTASQYRLFTLFVLVIPGWILVPIAVAGIAGLLKR